MTRLRLCSFGRNATEVTLCPYQCVILRGHDANLSYCRRWYLKDVAVPARFLCCKLIMSPFVINKYLGVMEILGDYAGILVILKFALTNWRVRYWILSAPILI